MTRNATLTQHVILTSSHVTLSPAMTNRVSHCLLITPRVVNIPKHLIGEVDVNWLKLIVCRSIYIYHSLSNINRPCL